MDIQVAYMDWSRMGMSIRNKIRDYKLRHLRLGRVKNLDKDRFDTAGKPAGYLGTAPTMPADFLSFFQILKVPFRVSQ